MFDRWCSLSVSERSQALSKFRVCVCVRFVPYTSLCVCVFMYSQCLPYTSLCVFCVILHTPNM